MNHKVYLFLFTLFFYSFCSTTNAAENDVEFEEIIQFTDSLIEEIMAEEKLVGAGISLVFQGDRLWSKGYGLASQKNNIPFTDTTNNSLLELAKLFTAVAVMQLVEQGKITLDAPFNSYITDFSPYIGSVGNADFTIRQLLSHHSGLPSQYLPDSGFFPGLLPEDFNNETAYQNLPGLSQNIALVSSPGQVYSYSYLAYSLLGLLIEEISGLDYADYIKINILDPLGMSNTYFASGQSSIMPASTFIDSTEYSSPRHYRDLPAVGLISNAADMVLFSQALVTTGKGIISQSSLQEMSTPQNDGVLEDDNFKMGLGFFITPVTGGAFRNEKFISHASDAGVVRSYFIGFPEYQMSVLFTTNTQLNSVKVRDTTDKIITFMFDSVTDLSSTPYQPHDEIDFSNANFEPLIGNYSGPGGTYLIEQKGKKLKLKVPAIPFLNITLIPREDDFFGVSIKIFGFIGLGILPQMKQLSTSLEGKIIEISGKKHIYWYFRGVAGVTLTEIETGIQNSAFSAWMARTESYQADISETTYDLEFDPKSVNFLFGPHRKMFAFMSEPPELFCVMSEHELRRCGHGLEGTGTKNVLRYMDDGRLLDAYGMYYSLENN